MHSGTQRRAMSQVYPVRNVTGEKDVYHLFAPAEDRTGISWRANPTLYRVAVNAPVASPRRKAIQVCIIPSITTHSPSILDFRFVPESQLDIHEP